jgi:hypothetical protein
MANTHNMTANSRFLPAFDFRWLAGLFSSGSRSTTDPSFALRITLSARDFDFFSSAIYIYLPCGIPAGCGLPTVYRITLDLQQIQSRIVFFPA